jgi:hypothetical protein
MIARFRLLYLLALLAAAGQALCQESGGHEYYGHLRLRTDLVEDLPGGREIERLRTHSWLGIRLFPSSSWEFGAAAKFALGSDSNSDNIRNLDNEKSNEFDLGELYARYSFDSGALFELGQTEFPFWLSPLVWDNDLRPIGASVQYETGIREFDSIGLMGGYFAGNHIDENDSRITAVQAAWRILEGAPRGGSIILTYLEFDDLEEIVADGRSRSNRVVDGRLVSDFELLDLQLQYRFPFWSSSLLTTVDLVKNLGASDQDEGIRASAILGNAWNRGEWELGYAYHRIERDAIMAAFNEDDWWFPSWMRGHSPWVAYGIGDDLRLRLAAFVEQRDDRHEHLKRFLVDISWHF